MKQFSILLSLLMLVSCYRDEQIDGQLSDEFYVRNGAVDMPVWVRGNTDAKEFIIFLHGGPLGNAIENAIAKDFEMLYDKYAFVFYDQRGGGFTHGNRTINLNEEQVVDDLDKIVDFIKFQYDNAESLFLMGHSWGGYLGTKYLTDANRQAKIDGWIELAGAHNFQLNWQKSKEYVLETAQQRIDNGEDADGFWAQSIEDLNALGELQNLDDVNVINWRAQRLEAELISRSDFPSPSSLDWLVSPAGIGFTQKDRLELEQVVVSANLNDVMDRVTLPSLLIYGAKDAIVPAALGDNGMEFLGTSEEDKSLVVLPNSGHDLWRFDTEDFFNEIHDFIEQYK